MKHLSKRKRRACPPIGVKVIDPAASVPFIDLTSVEAEFAPAVHISRDG